MKLTLCAGSLLLATGLLQLAGAVTINQIDTFQSGTTENWFAGGLGFGSVPPVPPHVVSTGGPAGAGDQFLLVTAQGGSGPGSRLVAMNLAQWAGDYLHSGVGGIAMDLKNFGGEDLTIRLLLEDPMGGPPADVAVSTVGAFLPQGGDWTHVFFPIHPSSLTTLSGDVNALLSNTTLLRIIHSSTPDEAEPVAGVLGVDNISSVPEPATLILTAFAITGLVWRRRR